MLTFATLSTNIKILIGLSIVTIVGIIYTIIRNIYKSSLKKETFVNKPTIEGNNDLTKFSRLNNKLDVLIDINKNANEINKNTNNNISELISKIDNIYKFVTDTHHNVRTNVKKIILNNLNTNFNNGILEIKEDEVKNDLGFPYVVYSIAHISSIINSDSTDTTYVSVNILDSNLNKILANHNTLTIIPFKHLTGTINNEKVIIYNEQYIKHHKILNPINIDFITLQFLKNNGNVHNIGSTYSITIELLVEQGNTS